MNKELFSRNRVGVAGFDLDTAAYPNVPCRISQLEAMGISAEDIKRAAAPTRVGGSFDRGTYYRLRRVLSLTRLALSSFYLAFWILGRGQRLDAVYVSYPGVFAVWLLSFLPKPVRIPRLFLDSFISWYDTAVIDRASLEFSSLSACLLYAIERRSFATCERVFVDTPSNAVHFAKLFRLPSEKIEAVPLAIDEILFTQELYRADPARCRVLFIGTFVPLHGVETIFRAAQLLAEEPGLEIRIIGQGQVAHGLDALGRGLPRHTTWIRDWKTGPQLAREISDADVCLGIFGATTKAQRVWPFKNYLYMCVGRAIITGATEEARRLLAASKELPFLSVPIKDALALANAIRRLRLDISLREALARAGRCCFEANLSSERSAVQIAAAIKHSWNDEML